MSARDIEGLCERLQEHLESERHSHTFGGNDEEAQEMTDLLADLAALKAENDELVRDLAAIQGNAMNAGMGDKDFRYTPELRAAIAAILRGSGESG